MGLLFYFYVTGTCNKFKLPLRYGRSQNLSVIAFIKVIQRNGGSLDDHNPVFLKDGKKKKSF